MGNSPSEICGGTAALESSNATFGVFMPEDGTPGMSPVLRWAPGDGSEGSLEPPATKDASGNGTVWAFVEEKLKRFGPNRCVGWRRLLKRDMEGKFEKLTLDGKFQWWTYAQFEERVVALSSGLPVAKGDAVLIFAETQRDWMVTALACFRVGCVVATAYATLGEEGVVTSLTQTSAKVCVCDAKLLKILTAAKSLPSTLEHVVTIGAVEVEGFALKVSTVEELQTAGRSQPKDAVPVNPSDLAVIMYTSGTTGTSKGVCITHENVVSMTLSFQKHYPIFREDDVFLAYLPLAHIMELTIELWLLAIGASMGYGSPHTLTDTGVKLQKGCQGDAPLLQPTCMLFAPAVLDKVYAAVTRKVEGGSAVAKYLFSTALEAGAKRFRSGKVGAGPLWNALVMKKIQALIGGRCRFCASGSAPLSPDVQIFVQTCFNSPVRQGYGCTETCGGSCVGNFFDNATGSVGGPTPVTYIRLRDWEEGNYVWNDGRRGEVLLGGPATCAGYFVYRDDPEMRKKNDEDFVEINGIRYFCTGDIGEIDDRGRIKIVDRKKDLFKGATGEYVALSKVEAALKLSSFVEMPCVYGKTGEPNVIALVCPQKPAIETLAKSLGLDGKPYGPDLCKLPEIIAAVSDALKAQCKKAGLHAFETPKAFRLCVAPDGSPAWTPDNGFLTSTMKLKRPLITKAFQADIDAAYATSSG